MPSRDEPDPRLAGRTGLVVCAGLSIALSSVTLTAPGSASAEQVSKPPQRQVFLLGLRQRGNRLSLHDGSRTPPPTAIASFSRCASIETASRPAAPTAGGPALPRRQRRREEGGAQLGPVGDAGDPDPASRAAAVLRVGCRTPHSPVHATGPAPGGASGLGRRGLPARQRARSQGENRCRSGLRGRPGDQGVHPEPAVHRLRGRRAARPRARWLRSPRRDVELARGRRFRLPDLGAVLRSPGSRGAQVAMPGATRDTGTAPEETVLDVEALASLAPGLERITPIFVPLDQSFRNSFALFMFGALDPARQGGRLPHILSISDGVCESRFTLDQLNLGARLLTQAAAIGHHHPRGLRRPGLRGLLHQPAGRALPGQLAVHHQRRRHRPDLDRRQRDRRPGRLVHVCHPAPAGCRHRWRPQRRLAPPGLSAGAGSRPAASAEESDAAEPGHRRNGLVHPRPRHLRQGRRRLGDRRRHQRRHAAHRSDRGAGPRAGTSGGPAARSARCRRGCTSWHVAPATARSSSTSPAERVHRSRARPWARLRPAAPLSRATTWPPGSAR